MSIDFSTLDQTDHGHVPFVYILVQAAEKWKASVRTGRSQQVIYYHLNGFLQHGGKLPETYAEKKEFKAGIEKMKVKIDEENFDEAVAQAYRVTPGPAVPRAVSALFDEPKLQGGGPLTDESTSPFFHLLAALREYVSHDPQTLPVSATLPDMHTDTKSYVELQTIYKDQARKERDAFARVLEKRGRPGTIDEGMIDDFVKNSHGLKICRSGVYGALDQDPARLSEYFYFFR
jgi:amyloid beta precursor protein binding protein 1